MSDELRPVRMPSQIQHTWRECQGIKCIDPQTMQEVPGTREICDKIWAGLSDMDKLNFHKGSCRNEMNASIKATMQEVIRQLKQHGFG